MDYSNVSAFVHTMIQAWKPVYRQCDYVLDTTNGRTYDFMKAIERQLDTLGIQFKARRQPRQTEIVSKNIQAETKQQKERRHEKNSITNKRWRRTRDERSHSGHHKKGNS